MKRRSLVASLAVAALRAVVRLHPAPARQHYREQMAVALRDAISHAQERGAARAIRVAAAELLDVAWSGLAARRGIRVTAVPVSSHASGGITVLPTWLEWRHALRRLAARPGYSAIVIGALALGIGANTVVFSVADAVLFRGAPYPNAPRLVEIYNQPAQSTSFSPGLLMPAVTEWRQQKEIFEQVEGFNYGTFVVTSGAEPESLAGAYVTPGLFPVLGVRPAVGRFFEPGEDSPGRNQVVILSHQLWLRHFGGDPRVIGRRMVLDGQAHSIVGVMPRGFRFPAGAQVLWLPLAPSPGARNPRLQAVALLAAGVSEQMAQERSEAAAKGLQESRPMPAGWGIRIMPLRGTMLTTTTRQALLTLLGAVALVLLIACANVVNLFLAQAIARERELSIRAALGAGRWRLVRELLSEGMLLATAGGLAALAIAWWGIDAAAALAPDRITRFNASEIRFDSRVLLFTGLITFATALLFGILPALRASRSSLSPALAARTAMATRSHGRLRGALVVVEVALSVVLLVGAALLIKSFMRLQSVDIGYDPAGLLQVSISLPAARYPQAQRLEFFRTLQDTIRSMPGVRGVTTGEGLPGDASIHFAEIEIEGKTPDGKSLIIPGTGVAPDYFRLFGIPIVAGRPFTDEDTPGTIIISQSMAAKFWPGEEPVGSRMRLGERDSWKTVIGVAGEVKQEHRQARISEFEIYTPYWPKVASAPPAQAARQLPPGARVGATVFVRADDPMSLMPLIKQAVWRTEPGQPIGNGVLVEHTLAKAFAEQRFALTLMAVFAALALLLAVAGLYAVLSQVVVQRTSEIGVRMALGARAGDIWTLIVVRGMTLTAAGIAIGMVAAYALSKYIRSQLYETSPTDVASFAAVASVMTLVALAACSVPTRRALKIDPITALRTD